VKDGSDDEDEEKLELILCLWTQYLPGHELVFINRQVKASEI